MQRLSPANGLYNTGEKDPCGRACQTSGPANLKNPLSPRLLFTDGGRPSAIGVGRSAVRRRRSAVSLRPSAVVGRRSVSAVGGRHEAEGGGRKTEHRRRNPSGGKLSSGVGLRSSVGGRRSAVGGREAGAVSGQRSRSRRGRRSASSVRVRHVLCGAKIRRPFSRDRTALSQPSPRTKRCGGFSSNFRTAEYEPPRRQDRQEGPDGSPGPILASLAPWRLNKGG